MQALVNECCSLLVTVLFALIFYNPYSSTGMMLELHILSLVIDLIFFTPTNCVVI